MSALVSFNLFNRSNGRTLGGGITGSIPQAVQTTDNNDDFAQNRFILRQAWNTNYKRNVNYKKNSCYTI